MSINPRASNFVSCASLRIAKINRASPTRTANIHQNQPFLSSKHLSINSSFKKKQNPNAQQLIQLILTSLASNGEGAVRPVLGDPRDCTVECLGSCFFTPRSRATFQNSGVLYRWLPKRHEYIGKFSKQKVAPTRSSSFWILVRDFNDFNISGSSPKHGQKTFCRFCHCLLFEGASTTTSFTPPD